MLNVMLLMALGGAAPAQPETSAPAPAHVTVRVPEDARLYVDGVLCPQKTEVRSFDTGPLTPGRTYQYRLRAEVVRGERTLTVSQTVRFRSGGKAEVDFRDLGADAAPAKADGATPKAATPLTDEDTPAPKKAVPAPEGDPPLQGTASLRGDEVQLVYETFVAQQESRMRKVLTGGQQRVEVYTVTVWVAKKETLPAKIGRVQATVDGQPVEADRLAELLREPTRALFSVGQKVDPAYLAIYKPGTLVLVMPYPEPPKPAKPYTVQE